MRFTFDIYATDMTQESGFLCSEPKVSAWCFGLCCYFEGSQFPQLCCALVSSKRWGIELQLEVDVIYNQIRRMNQGRLCKRHDLHSTSKICPKQLPVAFCRERQKSSGPCGHAQLWHPCGWAMARPTEYGNLFMLGAHYLKKNQSA